MQYFNSLVVITSVAFVLDDLCAGQCNEVENPCKYFLLLYGDKNTHVDDRTKIFSFQFCVFK